MEQSLLIHGTLINFVNPMFKDFFMTSFSLNVTIGYKGQTRGASHMCAKQDQHI
jgi:hypothetical protein